MRVIDLHTSGHADAETIQALIQNVNPRHIIPVHTENAAWFQQCEGRTIVCDKTFTLT